MKILLFGATGAMGLAIRQQIKLQLPDSVVYLYQSQTSINDLSSNEILITIATILTKLNYNSPQLVIDFSANDGTKLALKYALHYKIPILIGTTGLDDSSLMEMHNASVQIPILYSANTSISVNILFYLLKKTNLALLLSNFDIEILDIHHNSKKDTPSGTALKLGELLATSRQQKLKDIAVFDRHQSQQKRKKGTIGFSSIRGGGVIGQHELGFYGENEAIKISSEVWNRESFAKGVIFAAQKIIKLTVGLYDFIDIMD